MSNCFPAPSPSYCSPGIPSNALCPAPQQMGNNPDDAIGVMMDIPNSCVFQGSAGDSQAANLIPNNGEYEYAGTHGSCAVSSTSAPYAMGWADGSCDCSGHCGWQGVIPQYKRTSYRAPAQDCCVTGNKTIGNYTCDPKYKAGPATTECDSSFTSFCDDPANIFSDKCQTWCKQSRNADTCNSYYVKYCTSAKLDPSDSNSATCRAALANYGATQAEPLTAVAGFCASHPSDDYCACITPTVQKDGYYCSPDDPQNIKCIEKQMMARPECYIQECTSGNAYQTSGQHHPTCPDLNVCNNEVKIGSNVGSYVATGIISQNCGNSTNNSTKTTPPVAESPFPSLKTMLEYFLIMLIIIISIFLGWSFMGNPTFTKKPVNPVS